MTEESATAEIPLAEKNYSPEAFVPFDCADGDVLSTSGVAGTPFTSENGNFAAHAGYYEMHNDTYPLQSTDSVTPVSSGHSIPFEARVLMGQRIDTAQHFSQSEEFQYVGEIPDFEAAPTAMDAAMDALRVLSD